MFFEGVPRGTRLPKGAITQSHVIALYFFCDLGASELAKKGGDCARALSGG